MIVDYYGKGLGVEEKKRKKQNLEKINQYQCDIAILWLNQKLKELGNDVKDEEGFKKDIMKQIRASWWNIETAAVLCTCETLFNNKHANKSLKDVFEKHGINIKKCIFSIVITENGVSVVDGASGVRKKVFLDERENKLYYSLSRTM